jgi:Uma2 family endonuclease
MMSASKILLTAEEFDNYPFEEDKRYELDEGALIEMTKPAYKHNRVLRKLHTKLDNFLEERGLGELMDSENLYAIAPRTRLAPDLAVILGDRSKELEHATVIPIIPEIAIEILSPHEQARRIHRKLKQYFEAGVKEIWVLDPGTGTAEIWTAPSLTYRDLSASDSLSSPLLPGFDVPLATLFA